MPVREIERTRHISHHTVKKVYDRAQAAGLTWDAAGLLGEGEIVRALFSEEAEAGGTMGKPDWDDVHRRLAGVDVTLKLLWEKYCDSCREGGKSPHQLHDFRPRVWSLSHRQERLCLVK